MSSRILGALVLTAIWMSKRRGEGGVCAFLVSGGIRKIPAVPPTGTCTLKDAAEDILSQLAGSNNLTLREKPFLGSKADLILEQAGEYNREAVQSTIESLIHENPVAIMTFTECPYCIEARSILDAEQARYGELNLDTVGRNSYGFRAELYHMTGRTSVPAIWIGGEFVGGCNDGPMGGLMSLRDEGRLRDLLQNAGAC